MDSGRRTGARANRGAHRTTPAVRPTDPGCGTSTLRLFCVNVLVHTEGKLSDYGILGIHGGLGDFFMCVIVL